jgi:succinate dehydrogenase / fumarate reductase cytochrome b subunit
MTKRRPKHLDLTKIRLPLPGFVSILHRISGALLFLLLPVLLCLFQASLGTADSFADFKSVLAHPLVKLFLIGLIWAFLHHLCAGIRFLALDLRIGDDLQPARASSVAVLAVSLIMTAIIGVKLW